MEKITVKDRTAIIEHVCDACGKKISEGDKYALIQIETESGEKITRREHSTCHYGSGKNA